jgi:hypothetical protein
MAEASLRFRLFDGTDLGPMPFPLATTVGAVKEAIVQQWPAARAPTTRPPRVARALRTLRARARTRTGPVTAL